MSKYRDYMIVKSETGLDILRYKVREFLRAGWECTGGVSVYFDEFNTRVYIQAIVLK